MRFLAVILSLMFGLSIEAADVRPSQLLSTNRLMPTNFIQVVISPGRTNGTRTISIANLFSNVTFYGTATGLTASALSVQTNGVAVGSASTINYTTGVTGYISAGVLYLGVTASGSGGGTNFDGIVVTNKILQTGGGVGMDIAGALLLRGGNIADSNVVGRLNFSAGGPITFYGTNGIAEFVMDKSSGQITALPSPGGATNFFQVVGTNGLPNSLIDSNGLFWTTNGADIFQHFRVMLNPGTSGTNLDINSTTTLLYPQSANSGVFQIGAGQSAGRSLIYSKASGALQFWNAGFLGFQISGNGTTVIGGTALMSNIVTHLSSFTNAGGVDIAGGQTNWAGATVKDNLTLPHLTASRAAVLNSSGQLTNAAGTPDGTKFLRDDNTYAVPSGSGGMAITGGTNVLWQNETNRMPTGSTIAPWKLQDTNGNTYAHYRTNGVYFHGTNANGLWVSNSAIPGVVAIGASNNAPAITINGGDNSMTLNGTAAFTGTGVGAIAPKDNAQTEYSQLEAPFDIQTNNVFRLFSNGTAGIVIGGAVATGTNQLYSQPITTGVLFSPTAGSANFTNAVIIDVLTLSSNLTISVPVLDNVATNSTANSNLTMNTFQGERDIYVTNNLSLTNFLNLPGAGQARQVTWAIHPQLVNRALVLPTLGGPQFGVQLFTNKDNQIPSTLLPTTNYILGIKWISTNGYISVTEWK